MVASLVASLVLAGSNSPERALERTKEEILLKLNVRCGSSITVRYDGDSLRQHNKDIAYDQTGGDRECNEPLRYLWALCGSDEGKAIVRRSEVRELVCRGTPKAVGSLSFDKGVITVERAFEERDSFLRARKQFEAAFKTKLTTLQPDPYYDEAWSAFRQEENPVLSTTDFCLVNGEKKAFDWSIADQSAVLNASPTVKCFEGGKLVIELTIKNRKKTGLLTIARDDFRRRTMLVDDRPNGLEEAFDKGVLQSQTTWKAGERVISKELYPTGKLHRYWRQLPGTQVSLELREDGKVLGLSCAPEVKDDEVLRSWCGFGGEKTVEVYDGTNAISVILTHRDGKRVREQPGASRYGSRSAVGFVDGERDGEERVTRDDGTLERTISWKRGKKTGVEREYGKDGKKVIAETSWREDDLERRIEYFLNGNKKLEDVRDGQTRKVVRSFDLGGVERSEAFVSCRRPYGEPWCEDGLATSFYEGGQKRSETVFKNGERLSSRSWYPNGRLESAEAFEAGRLSTRVAYFPDGGVAADEAFEEDGSRRLKR